MYILGISAYYHDSAAALIQDGVIIAAAQEERFTRIKNDPSFPHNAISYCLEEANITLKEVSAIIYYEKPFLKFERILESFYTSAPLAFKMFFQVMPVWLKNKLFFRKLLKTELKQFPGFSSNQQILYSTHHLSHAASAFFVSPYKEAAILTIDGVGEWATLTISRGTNNSIKILRQMSYPNSLGLYYSAFTYYLGFRINSGEYKMMGLAPYADKDSSLVKHYIQTIKEKLVTIHEDGSIQLNMNYFTFNKRMYMVDNKKWYQLFNLKRRDPNDDILTEHEALACACQLVLEEIVLLLVKETKKITQLDNLCLAGGVALNCVSNGKIVKSGIFSSIFIQPAAGDAGCAIGAALCAYYINFKKDRNVVLPDSMKNSYLGPSFTDDSIQSFLDNNNVAYKKVSTDAELVTMSAKILADGFCIGWFQNRMEFGPRALGNRSILADPRVLDMQSRLNMKIKFRESFRPFAPAVLEELSEEYFLGVSSSRYMLRTADISPKYRLFLPDNYHALDYKEKLALKKSLFPAITHVDFSARVQTVSKDTNLLFHSLLEEFYKLTSCPMLINTSFNVRGEPIVCTPQDAYNCFIKTNLDYLVLGHYILKK